eukprot:3560465-Amphidinium_carterae.1
MARNMQDCNILREELLQMLVWRELHHSVPWFHRKIFSKPYGLEDINLVCNAHGCCKDNQWRMLTQTMCRHSYS